MIYTVTFNPALDYTMEIDNLKIGEINRSQSEMILPGGKGINVSTILNRLHVQNTAMGFVAGFTGQELTGQLQKQGINTDFIELKNGQTRINVKLEGDKETAINGNGPDITQDDINKLILKLENLKEKDILVLSGSIPCNIRKTIYEEICERLQNKNIDIVVDATGDLLVNVLKYHPLLIKPNTDELSEIFNREITSNEDIAHYGKKLKDMGAKNVIVSMGNRGATLITNEGEVIYSPTPDIKIINTVGAGDSMVAGFIAGLQQYGDMKKALKLGISAGSATSASKYLGTEEEILKTFNNILFE